MPEPVLRVYNTLTRMKEEFSPIDPQNVRMYVCGPTVYDFAHIGNARPVIVFDVLYRLLKHLYPGSGNAADGSRVTYVRNITDVDDKINRRALERFGDEFEAGKMTLNQAIRKVTEETASQFHEDVKALGCLEPTHEPRATEHIGGMVEMIQQLLDKNHAYVAAGAEGREVLFDIRSMADYGALSNRKLDDQQAGARIDVKDHKKNPGDFVLWKESSATEPGWDGTFTVDGRAETIHGRPGWHIECSVMSKAHLGERFDIHGGGLDLIFPHHENEIAQSRCAHGSDLMANVWMHNGYLQVEGKKMSKSEGNFVTIHDLLHTEKFGGRKWPGEVLRLAMLMTHYREPIDFSVKRLEEAENTLSKWRRWIEYHSNGEIELDAEVAYALSDDLNTSRLFRIMSKYSTDASGSWFSGGEPGPPVNANARQNEGAKRLAGALEFLGISRKATFDIEEAELNQSINRRLAFIAEKNWAEADKIRDDLLAQGIQLKDSKDSETGERVTTWEVKR